MNDAPTLSVVIPVHNGAATIDAQLGALAAQQHAPPWELIVVDNRSTDETRARVEAWRDALPNLRLVDAPERAGVSYTRNVGIQLSSAPAWAVCDADDVVSLRWVRAMADALRTNDLVTGTLDHDTLNHTKSSLRPGGRTHTIANYVGFLPYAFGCNLGATREVFDRVGGFDEDFKAGGDDVAFSWDAILSGAELAFAPDAELAYRHRDDLRQAWRQLHMYSRATPHLYRRFRSAGMPRRPIIGQLKPWAWLLTRAPLAALPGRSELRRLWLRQSARLTGSLRGALEARVLYL